MKKIYVIMTLCAMFLIGCTKTEISEEKAKEIAFSHANISQENITNIQVEKDKENGIAIYSIEFYTDEAEYDYEISQTNGTIIKSEVETYTNNTIPTTQITKDEAKEIALKDASVSENKTSYLKVKQDYENDTAVYEVEFYADGKEYDYTISKNDGTILSKDYDIENYTLDSSDNASIISLEEAKKLVLERIDGANSEHISIYHEFDDGVQLYEGEVHYQNKEYEFKINATTKEFIEWSVEQR